MTHQPCIQASFLIHDWRLIDEKPHERERSQEELDDMMARLRAEAQRLMGDAWTHEVPSRFIEDGLTVRRWYCTRCRTIEERIEE